MLLPPDELDGHDVESYDVPRGTCPRCGGGEVHHLIVGMPSGPDAMDRTPHWVEWVGCVHPGHDRECDACDHAWSDPDGTPSAGLARYVRAAH